MDKLIERLREMELEIEDLEIAASTILDGEACVKWTSDDQARWLMVRLARACNYLEMARGYVDEAATVLEHSR